MTTLTILKAQHGDGFIIKTEKGEESYTILIDGGPDGAYPDLCEILDKPEFEKIDMVILTHFDDDHINALSQWLSAHPDRAENIRKYWFNLPQFIPMPDSAATASYGQAITLFNFMEKLEEKSGKTIDWRDHVIVGCLHKDEENLIKLSVIAPTEDAIKKNEKTLAQKESDRLEKEGKLYPLSDENMEEENARSPKMLEELQEKDWKSTQIINDASIAFIFEAYDGTSILFTGDALAKTMTESLINRGHTPDKPLEINLLKMPHHGSKFNISNDLLSVIKTNRYLITTNGGSGTSKHPDRETLAKIILNPARNLNETIDIYINYNIELLRAHQPDLLTDEEISNEKYNFRIKNDTEELIFNK